MRVSLPLLFPLAPLALLLLAAFACSDPPPAGDPDKEEEEEEDPDKDQDPPKVDPPDTGAPIDSGQPSGQVIFGHSATTLYRYDPVANTATEVGLFNCVPHDTNQDPQSLENDSVIDLAVDRTGQIFATTYWRFIKVDPTNASCTVIRTDTNPQQYPNSLSFVPVGGTDALVGYAFDEFGDATIYTRIDLTTGEMTDTGNLNPQQPINGEDFGISGDFITIGGTVNKTFAAVIQLTGDVGAGNDLVAEIDPLTGSITRIVGDTGQQGFFGVGFANAKAYGFAAAGGVFELDITTGTSKLALDAKDKTNLPIAWFGAGAQFVP